MEFFMGINVLLQVCRVAGTITNMFIDETALLLDNVGNSDYEAAKKCLQDAKLSNNKEREFNSAITLLRSGIEKLNDNNKHKFQGAVIIAVCYRLLGDAVLTNRYIDVSKEFFNKWIDKKKPYGLVSFGVVKMGWRNYLCYKEFKEEIESIGLKWKGSFPMPSLLAMNPVLMNSDVNDACHNAIVEFNDKVDNISIS